jgi:hypothetical protein
MNTGVTPSDAPRPAINRLANPGAATAAAPAAIRIRARAMASAASSMIAIVPGRDRLEAQSAR